MLYLSCVPNFKMMLLFCGFVVVFLAGRLEAKHIGEPCIYAITGESTTCQMFNKCQLARNALYEGIDPQVCTGDNTGTVSIVCCPTGKTTTTDAPVDYSRFQTQTGQCPPLVESAVKAKKMGKKSWDKCIDLAESVWPCTTSGFLVNAPKTRTRECAHESTTLIVGGTAADSDEFPHMASLGYGDPDIKWYCGGSLISEQWVLTAAHCLHVPVGEKLQHVRLGGSDRSSSPPPAFLFSVKRIVKHPEYKPIKIYNDIALIQLDKNTIFSRQIRPACLHTGEPVDDTKSLVSGWGATQYRGNTSDILLKTTVHKFTLEDCSESHPKERRFLPRGIDNATQICYGHETRSQDTCQGDSGGPLQIYNNANVDCTYLVIGITSNGKTCGVPGIPGIYTRVSAYISWIESVVWPDED